MRPKATSFSPSTYFGVSENCTQKMAVFIEEPHDQPQKIRLFPDFFQSNSPVPWLHFSNLLDLQVAKVASGVSDSDDDKPAIVAGTVLLGCV